jgi:transcription antitermination factor NusG
MSDHYLPADLHDPKWFVLFVRYNQEKRTAHRLAEYGVEHFLPCCRSLRQWKDRRVTLEMPLFPGYVFVRLPFVERARVLTMPNVVSLVGGRNSPSAVSEEEINWIKLGIEHGNAMPHPELAVGQRVRIVAGALAGMQGILLRRQNGTRVVICLDSISRSFVVEVDLAAIEPVVPLRLDVGNGYEQKWMVS